MFKKALFIALPLLIAAPVASATDSMPGSTTSQQQTVVDDTAITTAVKAKLLADPAVSGLAVTVSTTNGVVILSGTIKTDTEATKIIEIAQSTPSVKDVNTDNLKVTDGKQPFTDTVITAKVKGMYLKEELMGNKNAAPMAVTVETKDGVVYLSGTVENNQQIQQAIRIAENIDGVKSVKSTLTLTNNEQS